MSFKFSFAAAAALALASPTFAEPIISISDAYARSAMATAKTGAVFMMVENTGDEADQLIDVRSDKAKKVELHTHSENADGVMRMLHVPEGFLVAAGGAHQLQRGGDHVMFMGLTGPWKQGDMIALTLVFEKSGDITVEVPVDLQRKPNHNQQHGKMEHDSMQHGKMKHDSEDHDKKKKMKHDH